MKVTCLSSKGVVLTTCDNFYVRRESINGEKMYLVVSYYDEKNTTKGYTVLRAYHSLEQVVGALELLSDFISSKGWFGNVFKFPKDIVEE